MHILKTCLKGYLDHGGWLFKSVSVGEAQGGCKNTYIVLLHFFFVSDFTAQTKPRLIQGHKWQRDPKTSKEGGQALMLGGLNCWQAKNKETAPAPEELTERLWPHREEPRTHLPGNQQLFLKKGLCLRQLSIYCDVLWSVYLHHANRNIKKPNNLSLGSATATAVLHSGIHMSRKQLKHCKGICE